MMFTDSNRPNCASIACSILLLLAALLITVYQTIFGVSSLSACTVQPLLPALLTAAGACNCAYLIVVTALGWFVFSFEAPSPVKIAGKAVNRLCICLLACVPVALTVAPIVLNIWAGFLFSRDFTVTGSAPHSTITAPAAAAAGLRVLNPIVSLDNPLHPRYCSRQLVEAVPIICSAYFQVAEAVVFLLPVVFWCCRLICQPCQLAEKSQEEISKKLIEEGKAKEESGRPKPMPSKTLFA